MAPVVAVVGGGQLARMMQQAAIRLGVHLRALVEAADGSTGQVVPDAPVGRADDPAAVRGILPGAHALTFEHEHVPGALLQELEAEGVAVRPGSFALRHAQDKIVMRTGISELGVPCPRWAPVSSRAELADFGARAGWPVVVKTARGGYDGKGVRVVHDDDGATDWLDRLGPGEALLAEEHVPFVRELAALVARRPSGEIRAWVVAQTIQRDGVCAEVIAPAPGLDPVLAEQAQEIAVRIAEGLDVTGVLAVELFEVAGDAGGSVAGSAAGEVAGRGADASAAGKGGSAGGAGGSAAGAGGSASGADGSRLLVNELAMRPHNSGHWTIDGAATSQFEQHLRAVLDLPLGPTDPRAPVSVMVNLLGSELADPTTALPDVLARCPRARVELYGKEVRPGRKLGHVTVYGDDLESARTEARLAVALLRGEPA